MLYGYRGSYLWVTDPTQKSKSQDIGVKVASGLWSKTAGIWKLCSVDFEQIIQFLYDSVSCDLEQNTPISLRFGFLWKSEYEVVVKLKWDQVCESVLWSAKCYINIRHYEFWVTVLKTLWLSNGFYEFESRWVMRIVCGEDEPFTSLNINSNVY